MLLGTRDELIEERGVIKEAVRCTYRRWTIEFEMMRSMSGGKGQDLGDPEMVQHQKNWPNAM